MVIGMTAFFSAMADNFFWTIVAIVAVVSIVFSTIRAMVVASQRERTRREIAAYIAEGSMTPEQGERLMKARENDE